MALFNINKRIRVQCTRSCLTLHQCRVVDLLADCLARWIYSQRVGMEKKKKLHRERGKREREREEGGGREKESESLIRRRVMAWPKLQFLSCVCDVQVLTQRIPSGTPSPCLMMRARDSSPRSSKYYLLRRSNGSLSLLLALCVCLSVAG